MPKKPIQFKQYAHTVRISAPASVLPINDGFSAHQHLMREMLDFMANAIMDDAYPPDRPPPEPPPWLKKSSMACISCGKRGVIEYQEGDDPESWTDPHRCTGCGVKFDLYVDTDTGHAEKEA